MKHIENKNGKTQIELKNDSTTWGNYRNATFEIRKGKYSIDRGKTFTEVTGTYTKPTRGVLLTTGETEKNSVLNIYDLAGNESEWTLEGNTSAKFPCINRGGDATIQVWKIQHLLILKDVVLLVVMILLLFDQLYGKTVNGINVGQFQGEFKVNCVKIKNYVRKLQTKVLFVNRVFMR